MLQADGGKQRHMNWNASTLSIGLPCLGRDFVVGFVVLRA